MSTEPKYLRAERHTASPSTTARNAMLRYIDTLKNVAHAARIGDSEEVTAALNAHDEAFQ